MKAAEPALIVSDAVLCEIGMGVICGVHVPAAENVRFPRVMPLVALILLAASEMIVACV